MSSFIVRLLPVTTDCGKFYVPSDMVLMLTLLAGLLTCLYRNKELIFHSTEEVRHQMLQTYRTTQHYSNKVHTVNVAGFEQHLWLDFFCRYSMLDHIFRLLIGKYDFRFSVEPLPFGLAFLKQPLDCVFTYFIWTEIYLKKD